MEVAFPVASISVDVEFALTYRVFMVETGGLFSLPYAPRFVMTHPPTHLGLTSVGNENVKHAAHYVS